MIDTNLEKEVAYQNLQSDSSWEESVQKGRLIKDHTWRRIEEIMLVPLSLYQ